MNKVRIIAAVLALVVSMSAFAGCSPKDRENENASVSVDEEVSKDKNNNVSNGGKDKVIKPVFPEEKNGEITVEKIGSFEQNGYITMADGGMYYRADNDKYGVLSNDGKHDTGAKYTDVTYRGRFFVVTTKEEADISDVKDLNSYGVIDAEGNEFLPEEYASVKALSDRYIYAAKVTEKTSNEDDALIFASNDGAFSIFADEDDILFKGEWCVYDTQTGQFVEGASGTKPFSVLAQGDFLSFYNDDEEHVIIDGNGNIFEDADYISDGGYYEIEKDGVTKVYDDYHNELFSFTDDEYLSLTCYEDYIYALKADSNKRVMLDFEGNVVSGEFKDIDKKAGRLILSEDKVYTADGTCVYDKGIVNSIYYDSLFGRGYILRKADEKYVYISADLQEITEFDADVSADVYSFEIYKKTDNGNVRYNFKEKQFNLQVRSNMCNFLAKNEDYKSVIDCYTGEKIIDGDYSDFMGQQLDDKAYIYGKNGDSYDVYLVK